MPDDILLDKKKVHLDKTQMPDILAVKNQCTMPHISSYHNITTTKELSQKCRIEDC